MDRFGILIVCTGNICRSPMAEGLLKHLLPHGLAGRIVVGSAGTYALHGNQPAPLAVDVMAQLGINIRSHRARQVDREMLRRADLTLGMEKGHVQLLRKWRIWKRASIRLLTEFDPDCAVPEDAPDVEDPYGGSPAVYQECLRVIRPCVDGVIQWLVKHENNSPANS